MTISSDQLTRTFEEPIQNLLREHMTDQPYDISCSVCGEILSSTGTIDCDFDLILQVAPCETCLETAADERETAVCDKQEN